MGKRRVRVDVWQYIEFEGVLERCRECTRYFDWHWQAKEFMAEYNPRCFEFVVTKGCSR